MSENECNIRARKLYVPCPTCDANIGRPCRTRSGKPAAEAHVRRSIASGVFPDRVLYNVISK